MMECSENHSAFHYFNSFSWSNLESFTSFRKRKGKKTECKAKSIQEANFYHNHLVSSHLISSIKK